MVHTTRNEVIAINSIFRLRELRMSAGLTQAQLAARLELKSPSTVAMWESGDRHPSSVMLPRIAEQLNTTVDELYER